MWAWFVVYFVLTADGRVSGPHYIQYGDQLITCQLYGEREAYIKHKAISARCIGRIDI